MTNLIDISNAKGYATEANLLKTLEKTGLADHPAERIICRKPDGKWTAIFLATRYLNQHGGYAGFAAAHGFSSI